jgi:hypothetical protein
VMFGTITVSLAVRCGKILIINVFHKQHYLSFVFWSFRTADMTEYIQICGSFFLVIMTNSVWITCIVLNSWKTTWNGQKLTEHCQTMERRQAEVMQQVTQSEVRESWNVQGDRKLTEPITNTRSICQKVNYIEIRKQKTNVMLSFGNVHRVQRRMH